MRSHEAIHDAAVVRRGITLLEVLIACGLLVVGLTTMASLLPAAGSRLAQAHLEDRGSILASNAFADVMNRRLASADAFANPAVPTLAFGRVFESLPTTAGLPMGSLSAAVFFTPLSAEGLYRYGSSRTFLLEDELTYVPPQAADTPSNSFAIDGGGSLGPRTVKPGVCWGATLARTGTTVSPARAGDDALLTIAIFKKDGFVGNGGDAVGYPVTLMRNVDCYQADVASGGPVLRACSWVLAIPSEPTKKPAWHQIGSAWVFSPPMDQAPRLVLRDQDAFAALTNTASTGSRATVIAFEGIVRVDQHPVKLF